MPAEAGRCFHQDVASLVAVDAASPFAVTATGLLISRVFLIRHSTHGNVVRFKNKAFAIVSWVWMSHSHREYLIFERAGMRKKSARLSYAGEHDLSARQ